MQKGIKEEKGFTLLVAIVVTSFLLIVSFSIGNIALKQLTLAFANQESQYAFYNAESGIECAAYWDLMNSTTTGVSVFDSSDNTTINCNGSDVAVTGDGVATSTFTVSNLPKGCVKVYIGKSSVGTRIESYGYNTCVAGALRKFERGISLSYESSGSTPPASSDTEFVQSSTANTTGPHQLTLSNAASGNSIFVGIAQYNSASRVYSVSDSQGNTYISIGSSTVGGRIAQVFLAQNITGDPNLVITVNQSGSAVPLNIVAVEASGITSVDTSGTSVDAVASNSHACSTPGIDTSTDVLILCVATLNSGGGTITSAGGYTKIGSYNNTIFQYKTSNVAVVGETATWNSTTARLSAEVLISLK